MVTLLEFNNNELVFLSFIMAALGSFVTLTVNERIVLSRPENRSMWIKTAALSMGLTAWTAHFTGLLSFALPLPILYHVPLTVASAALAVLAAYFGFHTIHKLEKHRGTFIAASVLMGAVFSVMHYIGIKALQVKAYVSCDLSVLSFATFLAMASSYLFIQLFYFFKRNRSFVLKLSSSLLMGAALSAVHYVNMHAADFYVPETLAPSGGYSSASVFLVIFILLPINLIFLFLTILSFFDRKTALQLAYIDALTNMPNRLSLENFIQARTTPLNLPVAVVILDIDNFTWINETYGYESGNKLIYEFACRLKKLTPQHGLAARIEGNRFAVAIPGTFSYKEIKTLLSDLFSSLQQSFSISGEPALITFSAGVAIAPEQAANGHYLILNAERALRHVKHNGKNEIMLYDSSFHSQDLERQIAMSLQHALKKGEFHLCYQPKLNVCLGIVDSVEALIRWESPSHGYISPDKFIPVAEKNGFIFDLTKWILNEACSQMKKWKAENTTIKKVAVNISAPMFLSDRLTETVKQTLHRHDLEACHLELEITETAIIKQFESALAVMDTLKKEGISISLDDFGTGVSSLTYLKNLPIDQLKIDKSFIDDIDTSIEDKALVEMIIQLAKLFGLHVVAEGVEKRTQLLVLKELGCDFIQGYFISRPERADVLTARYKKHVHTI